MPQVDIYTEPGPIPAGVQLRIYSNPICPFVQRVRLFAAAKGVSTEEINIHLAVKPEWYVTKINPEGKGKVPAIQLPDGRILHESLVAADYVDEAFDGKKLWPTDPFLKAQGKLIVESFGNKFIPNYYKNYRQPDSGEQNVELAAYLDTLEAKLKDSPFFSGQEAGAVDYLIWPWFERMGALQVHSPAFASAVNKDKFPHIFNWIDRMAASEVVKKTFIPTENHLAFLKSYTGTGSHDYGTVDLTGEGVKIYTRKE